MRLVYVAIFSCCFLGCTTSAKNQIAQEKDPVEDNSTSQIISHTINPDNGGLRLYWQGSDGDPLRSFAKLKDHINTEGKKLRFAMNGGMFLQDYSPQGLYIEKGKIIRKLNNKANDYGNFYMAPNGVFYITKDYEAGVITTNEYSAISNVAYATQSGPMLVIDGKLHPKFKEGSKNVHYRNGVGILPNGNVIFAISKEKINFYDFATFFLSKGCKNALYLDGFVSRLYLPEKGVEQMDGNFGVMIAEVE